MKPVAISETVKYQSEVDEGATYTLGVIDTIRMCEIMDEAIVYTGGMPGDPKVISKFRLNKQRLELVRYGLRGIEGSQLVYQANGNNTVSDHTLERMPLPLIQELGDEIRKINSLSYEDGATLK